MEAYAAHDPGSRLDGGIVRVSAQEIRNRWVREVRTELGPFRRDATGNLRAYAHPELAEDGDPVGIYVPAEDEIRRYLARNYADEWSINHVSHVVKLLQDESYPTFDEVTSPLIPMLNCVLDYTDPHNPQAHHHASHWAFTSQVPHAWDPTATAPHFDNWIREALPEDAVPLLYELIGYTLLPFQFLRKAVLLTGPSGTGKSTVLYVLEQLLGRGSVSTVPLQKLADDNFAAAALYGKLANIGGDLDSTTVQTTGLFKSLTGDDTVWANVKYGKPIQFRSGATQWYAANEPPGSRDHTDAWRERWVILPFDNKPPVPDFGLKARLTSQEELRGILRHAVEGLGNLLRRGHLIPSVTADRAHQSFVMQTDQVQEFIAHLRNTNHGGWVMQSQVYPQYTAWAMEEGHKPVKKKDVLSRMREHFSQSSRQGNLGFNTNQEA